MPKVSIIIPVYGVEKYIERCARSLFKQTLDDIEFLFVDDCTPDNSIEVLNEVLAEFPQRQQQTRLVRMDKNSGQAAVRMRGIREVKGDYVMFCDSDDWVDSDFCEMLYDKAKTTDSDIVVCDYNISSDEINSTQKSEEFPQSMSKVEMMKLILQSVLCSSLWNKIYRRSLLTEKNIIPPEGNMGEDMVIHLQALYYCNKISYLKNPLYYYFLNDCSITKDISEDKIYARFKSSTLNTQIVESFLKEKGLIDALDDDFTYLKLRKINYLLPLLSNKATFAQWKYTYPDLFTKVIKSKAIPVKEKISYYLTYFGFRSVLK